MTETTVFGGFFDFPKNPKRGDIINCVDSHKNIKDIYIKYDNVKCGQVKNYINLDKGIYRIYGYFGRILDVGDIVELWITTQAIKKYIYLLCGDEWDKYHNWVPIESDIEDKKEFSGKILNIRLTHSYKDMYRAEFEIITKEEEND